MTMRVNRIVHRNSLAEWFIFLDMGLFASLPHPPSPILSAISSSPNILRQ